MAYDLATILSGWMVWNCDLKAGLEASREKARIAVEVRGRAVRV